MANPIRYTLYMKNAQGASEETKHATKDDVRAQIRKWQARGMTASVYDSRVSFGNPIYEGSALSF